LENPSPLDERIIHVEELSGKTGRIQLIVAIVKCIIGNDIHSKGTITMVYVNWLSLQQRLVDALYELLDLGLYDTFKLQNGLARKDWVSNGAANSMQFIAGSCESCCFESEGIIEIRGF
jgi:hypothetical protein